MVWIKKIKYYHILLLISIISIVPVIVMCFFDRPNADDYCYAIFSHQSVIGNKGIIWLFFSNWNEAIRLYNAQTGSFFLSMIQSLQPGFLGEKYYVIAPILILLWMYICIRYLIGSINKYYLKMGRIISVTVSLWVLSFLLMWMPSITEGVYWFNGAANYTISIFALLMNIGLFINISECYTKKRFFYVFVSCLISILSAEGNILVSFASMLLTACITLLFVCKKKYYVILPCILCFIRFLFNYFSPGLNARANLFDIKMGYIETIRLSFTYAKNFIFSHLDIIIFLFLLSLTPFLYKIIKNKESHNRVIIKLFISLIVSFLLISAILCVPTYSVNNPMEYWELRIVNVVWYAFVIMSIINYYLIIETIYYYQIINFDLIKNKSLSFLMLICCLIILFGVDSSDYHVHSSFIRAKNELVSGVASSYAAERDEREQVLIMSKGKDVMVKPLWSVSKLLSFSDLTSDKTHWINCGVSEYYELKSVFTGYE